MSIISEIAADLRAAKAAEPRSAQVQTGASQNAECRASSVLRLRGVPRTDPRTSWQAEVGSAVDRRIGEVRAHRGVLAQVRLQWEGVPCTVDEIDGTVLRDWKTKDTAAEVESVRRYGPGEGQVGQVQINAQAAIAAGHPIERVQLVFIPRAGALNENNTYVWSDIVRPDVALAAVERIRERDRLAADPEVDVADLRDEPRHFCESFCEWVTACRGPLPPLAEPDVEAQVAAAEWLAAKVDEDEAAGRKARAQEVLDRYDDAGVDLRSVGLRYQWRGAKVRTDSKAVEAAYEALVGSLPKVPGIRSRSPQRVAP